MMTDEVVEQGETAGQFLTFMLSGEEYGVDILKVQEIKGWEEATPIPNCPEYVLGVMNLRGTIVPVLDLRLRFALPRPELGHTTVVIVLRIEDDEKEQVVGLVVDAVSDVFNFDMSQLRPFPDIVPNVGSEFVHGFASTEEKNVILLDIEGLVSEGIMARMEMSSLLISCDT